MNKFPYTITILLLLTMLLSTSTSKAINVINLQDEGIENHSSDLTPFIYDILSKNKNKKGLKIVFPKSTYHFYPTQAFGKYHAVTNHDKGFRYFAFPLIDFEDIEIDAQGSEFIFHGQIIPFLVERSTNVKICNANIYWEVPFYLEGSVIRSNKNDSTVDIKINEGFSNYELVDNRLIIKGEGWEETDLGENICFDPKTKAVLYRNDDLYSITNEWTKKMKAMQIGERTFRLETKFEKETPPTGSIITFKGSFGSNRHSPAFHLSDSKNISLSDINIYHAGGMGVVAEKTENIYLKSVNVRLRENSKRILSTTADATHFCNCKGDLVIEDCLFENMLDDACNVHGTYTKVERIIDPYTVIARLNHPQQFGFKFASDGDTIQVVSGDKLLPKNKLQIKSVEQINSQFSKFVFEMPILDMINIGDGLENIEWYPRLTFKENVIRNNRARSILVSTPKKVVIENNSFSSQMTGILIEGDMDHWFESGAVNDVTIQNNLFLDGTYGGGAPHVSIWVNPHLNIIDPDKAYESNIIIKNNVFKTFNDVLLRAHSVNNLQYVNNTI
ncbi:MAG: right-handed parallel beta-helix repeat-containing protein [Dysgonomonas sp.]